MAACQQGTLCSGDAVVDERKLRNQLYLLKRSWDTAVPERRKRAKAATGAVQARQREGGAPGAAVACRQRLPRHVPRAVGGLGRSIARVGGTGEVDLARGRVWAG